MYLISNRERQELMKILATVVTVGPASLNTYHLNIVRLAKLHLRRLGGRAEVKHEILKSIKEKQKE